MSIYTLININKYQVNNNSIIIKSRIINNNSNPNYLLKNENGLKFMLSDGNIITIPYNYRWDGSSVPRCFWSLFSTDGDFEIAALIHDFLYTNQKDFKYDRKFVDKEMLIWSNKTNGTEKRSFRNFDNLVRYYFVRLFGKLVWIKKDNNINKNY